MGYNLPPATCHLLPATCYLSPATFYTTRNTESAMSIHRSTLFTALILLLLAGGFYITLAQPAPQSVAPAPILPPATTTPLTGSAGAGENQRRVAFIDESSHWNWDVSACAGPLSTYLAAYPPQILYVTLTDNAKDLPLGVAYPDVGSVIAAARAWCDVVGYALTCQVAVEQATAGNGVDVAASAALGYAIWDAYRVRSQEATESQPAWDWHRFEPLIRPTGGDLWRSDCLTLYDK